MSYYFGDLFDIQNRLFIEVVMKKQTKKSVKAKGSNFESLTRFKGPVSEFLPRREPSPEEIKSLQDQDRLKLLNQRAVRCPACSHSSRFSDYMCNYTLGCLACPECGVLFMEKEKLKIIKSNLPPRKEDNTIEIIT